MIRFIWILLVPFLFCCTSVLVKTDQESDLENLRERIVRYWNAKKADDLQTIQSMIDPDTVGKSSEFHPPASQFARLIKMEGFRIDRIDMGEENSAKVIVTLELSFLGGSERGGERIEQTVRDHWVKKMGTWYINLNRPSFQEMIERFRKNSS